MSAITIHDDLVHYQVLGRGKPVVLIHGWLGSWRYWVATMQQIAVKYRCYAVDLWGFGDSAKDPSRYNLEWQLDLIDKFLDAMGIPKAVLVGHGLGAVIAARYGADPNTRHRVHRMMVVSPPLFDSAPSANPSFYPENAQAQRPTFALSDGSKSSSAKGSGKKPGSKLFSRNSRKNKPTKALIESRKILNATITTNPLKDVFYENSLEDLLQNAISPSSQDYEKLRAEVAKCDSKAIYESINIMANTNTFQDILNTYASTFALLGGHDRLLPLPNDYVLNRLDERGELKLIVMDNAHHYPMLDEAAQFTRLLKEFLEAPDISSLELKEEWRRRTR